MLRCFAPPELGISSNRFSNQSTNLLKIVKTEHVKAFFFSFSFDRAYAKKVYRQVCAFQWNDFFVVFVSTRIYLLLAILMDKLTTIVSVQ